MKKIILILTTLMCCTSSFALMKRGEDRTNTTRNENQREQSSTANAFYVPSLSNEIHRDTEVTAFREKRNPKYKKEDRLTAPSLVKAKEAKTFNTLKTGKEVEDAIWKEAAGDNEFMLNLKSNLTRHTYIWYKHQQYKELSNFDKEDEVKNIKKLLTQ